MTPTFPRWMGTVLTLAGIYNLAWGAWTILFPQLSFRYSGMLRDDSPLTYPQLWQCIGMIVGVYGIGYLIAAGNPIQHWPIVLVGFLGKIFGPIGYVYGVIQGETSPSGILTIAFNDLIWWIPFFLILREAWLHHVEERDQPEPMPIAEALEHYRTDSDQSLKLLSDQSPVLLVFLRHLGCVFCREALKDLARNRETFQREGTQLVLVHMADDASARELFRNYGMESVARVSDPKGDLYRAFGLKRAKLKQVLNWRVMQRGTQATFKGAFQGKMIGDPFRLPGVFLIDRGQVVKTFRHETVADLPDYQSLAKCDEAVCKIEL